MNLPTDMTPAMALALDANFGGFVRWREAFASLVNAQRGDSRAVQLSFLPRQGRLANHPAADAAPGLADAVPLLVLDGTAGADGIDASIARIDWAQVYARYQAAVHAASEGLGVGPEQIGRGLLFDVRRRGVFEQASQTLPGAAWRDPMDVAQWASALEPGAPVTVYCVYGHEVGRSTALRLRAAGIDARFLEGGIDGWTQAGRPLAAKAEPPQRS